MSEQTSLAVIQDMEINRLKKKCDRLVKALRRIESIPPTNIQGLVVATPESWWKSLVIDMRDQARAALQEALQEADDE